jgi:DNA-binding CsgD family transcriptional regulator
MSAIKDLSYDIQELYIEGHSARMIATLLECSIETVLSSLEDMGVADSEELSPFETVNS